MILINKYFIIKRCKVLIFDSKIITFNDVLFKRFVKLVIREVVML